MRALRSLCSSKHGRKSSNNVVPTPRVLISAIVYAKYVIAAIVLLRSTAASTTTSASSTMSVPLRAEAFADMWDFFNRNTKRTTPEAKGPEVKWQPFFPDALTANLAHALFTQDMSRSRKLICFDILPEDFKKTEAQRESWAGSQKHGGWRHEIFACHPCRHSGSRSRDLPRW